MNESANSLNALVSDTVDAVNQNADMNSELEKKFDEVKSTIINGSEGAVRVRDTLDTMKETVLVAGQATESLLEKISTVDEILREISKITMRTKILSLNASIEAAKAGKAGKGFSVVVDEIRMLAIESGDSSENIHKIITELTSQIGDVASKTSKGTETAIAGLESMEELLITLGNIRSANDTVASVVAEESKTNNNVTSKFGIVSEQIGSMTGNMLSISSNIGNVSSDIHKQNDAIKMVNDETGNMKVIIGSLKSKEKPRSLRSLTAERSFAGQEITQR